MAPLWRYTSVMPSVQIKNVPPSVHRTLRARAANSGKSLQEYLLEQLELVAREPALDEILDRAGGRAGGNLGFDFAADAIRSDRERG